MTTPTHGGKRPNAGRKPTMKSKIDWHSDAKANARYWITDPCTSNYVAEDQIVRENGKIASMDDVARAYAADYDHSGTDDEYAVCNIEDVDDGESHDFAFDGHGNFEWDTRRQT